MDSLARFLLTPPCNDQLLSPSLSLFPSRPRVSGASSLSSPTSDTCMCPPYSYVRIRVSNLRPLARRTQIAEDAGQRLASLRVEGEAREIVSSLSVRPSIRRPAPLSAPPHRSHEARVHERKAPTSFPPSYCQKTLFRWALLFSF